MKITRRDVLEGMIALAAWMLPDVSWSISEPRDRAKEFYISFLGERFDLDSLEFIKRLYPSLDDPNKLIAVYSGSVVVLPNEPDGKKVMDVEFVIGAMRIELYGWEMTKCLWEPNENTVTYEFQETAVVIIGVEDTHE